MNITRWAMNNRNTVIIFSIIIIIGGINAYFSGGKLKNPNFVIQTALVLTQYPGASASEVERHVTEPLEKAVQAMGSLKHVRSMSQTGLSTLFVDIKDSLPDSAMPQIWTDLRERIRDAQVFLPKGAGPSEVIDHFGRSYGILLALSGKGFSMKELRHYAEHMTKRLKLCKGAAGVTIFGIQEEQIILEISRERLAELQVNIADIYQAINTQNYVSDFGYLNAGDKHIRVAPTGNFNSVEQIENLVLGGRQSGKFVRLGDIVDVKREYIDPPEILFRMNGEPALAIGVSTIEHGNTITLGKSVKKALVQMTAEMPAGLEISVVNLQADFVADTVSTFIVALIEAILIVLFVLFLALGFRSALVITNGLVFNICGTFIVMYALGIDLQCISISSLIIVLGMLVDDSVVVTDNAMVRIDERGMPIEPACMEAAKATGWQQLVATFIAVASFLPVDLAKSATGQFCKSLFDVVAIALAISWLQAMIVVPVFSSWLLKPKKKPAEEKPPYSTRFYRAYLSLLRPALRHRWLTTGIVLVVFLLAGYGYDFIKVIYMPESDRPQYLIDYWLPEGTRIKKTSEDMAAIEKKLLSWPEIVSVATSVGSGPPRFMLGFTPEQPNIAYGNMIVRTKPKADVNELVKRTQNYINEHFPQGSARAAGFVTGGSPNYQIQARISGDDPVVLRELAEKVKSIMEENPGTQGVGFDWRNQVATWKPEFSQTAGGLRGIDRRDLAGTLRWLTGGTLWDYYRGGKHLVPIMIRTTKEEDHDIRDMEAVPVCGWGAGSLTVPMGSVLYKGQVVMENPIICRYDRIPTITVQCNPAPGVVCSILQTELAKKIKATKLPPGYTLAWGGFYELENESNTSMNAQLPLALALMIMAVVLLFNGLRGPLIIILTLPLSIVGIVVAFLLTGKGMSMMALIGMYGLIGMMIRNAVILIGEMDKLTKDKNGDERYQGVVQAVLTRVRPVLITACCTTFGMIPLLWNYLFSGMAMTIMAGLMFATLITLIFIPTLYVIFFRIPAPGKKL